MDSYVLWLAVTVVVISAIAIKCYRDERSFQRYVRLQRRFRNGRSTDE